MSRFRLIKSLDRDIVGVQKAIEAFQEVLARYPDTELRPTVEERIVEARNLQAGHDRYVARFYERRGRHLAGSQRRSRVFG